MNSATNHEDFVTALALLTSNKGDQLLDLLKAQPDIATASAENTENTLLHHAAELGRVDIIHFLLACPHVQPWQRNARHQNAAHVACEYKQPEIALLILDAIASARGQLPFPTARGREKAYLF